jgi:hypothetical protein
MGDMLVQVPCASADADASQSGATIIANRVVSRALTVLGLSLGGTFMASFSLDFDYGPK